MWLDPDTDGCIYDAVDCYHDCKDCEYSELSEDIDNMEPEDETNEAVD